MREIRLDGKRLTSEADTGDYVFDVFDFPEYYGDDLDALYDALADIETETYISIYNRDWMENSSYGSRLIWIFEDAASDNPCLYLSWTEPGDNDYE